MKTLTDFLRRLALLMLATSALCLSGCDVEKPGDDDESSQSGGGTADDGDDDDDAPNNAGEAYAYHLPHELKLELLARYDADGNGFLSPDETAKIESIEYAAPKDAPDEDRDISVPGFTNLKYVSLRGCRYFDLPRSVETLLLEDCTLEKYFSTGQSNASLRKLKINGCGIKTLDIKDSPELEWLDISNNELEQLGDFYSHIYGCEKLSYIDFSNNRLEIFYPGDFPALETIVCNNNRLQSIQSMENNTKLKVLRCHDNCLSGLDVSFCAGLQTIQCGRMMDPYWKDKELEVVLWLSDKQMSRWESEWSSDPCNERVRAYVWQQ